MAWHLERRKNGVYYARRYERGRAVRKSLQTKNRRVAETRLSHLNGPAPSPPAPSGRTLAEILPEFIAYKTARLSPRAGHTAAWLAGKWLLPYYPFELSQWTAARGELLQTKLLRAGLAPASVNRVCSLLRQLLKYAAKSGDLPPGWPLPPIPVLRELPPPIRVFSDAEIQALLSASATLGPEHARFTRLGLYAGLRKMEILSLRPADIDPQHKQLIIGAHDTDTFRPKSRRERRIPIHGALWPYLEPCGPYYFPGEGAQHPHRIDFRNPWAETLAAAGITWGPTPHALRHTFGTLLARSGNSAWQIMMLMGHASVRTSERYIHLAGHVSLHAAITTLQLPDLDL